ncbi:MAG: sugar phosphate nucleotidyltransferase [Verrucomicrobiota bacterium]
MAATEQAIILLGGLGTRLRSLHPDLPKALAPIAGRPFLQWQLDWLARFGITRIHLAAGHRADQVAAWAEGRNLTVSVEPEPLGTGGGLKFVEPWVDTESFFVVNGDTLVPRLDFEAMRIEPGEVSLAVSPVENTERYGAVTFDKRHRVDALHEKGKTGPGYVNAGMFLTHRSIFDSIEPDTFVSTEQEIFPQLIEQGKLIALPTDPPMLDMGTEDGFREMEAFLTADEG